MNSNQLVLSTWNKVQLCPTPMIFICLTLKVRISIKPWSEELQHSIILNLEFEGPIQLQIVLTLLNSDWNWGRLSNSRKGSILNKCDF